MYKFNNILICLDLTDADHFLIKYSNFIAKILKPANVIFLHVMETYDIPDDILDSFHERDNNIEDIIRKELEDRIDANFSIKNEVSFKLIIEQGLATQKIVNYAKTNDADLSILTGKGGVSKKVSGLLPSSVLLVNEKSNLSLKKLLVKNDFTETSYFAFHMARDIAKQTGVYVECLHVYKFPLNYFPQMTPDNAKDMKGELKERVDTEYAKFLEKIGVGKSEAPPCNYCIEYHEEESQLVYNYAIKNDFDMILVGTKIKSQITRILLENTSEKFVGEKKDIPVLIAKDIKKSSGFF